MQKFCHVFTGSVNARLICIECDVSIEISIVTAYPAGQPADRVGLIKTSLTGPVL